MFEAIEARLHFLAKRFLYLQVGLWLILLAFIAFAAMGLYVPRGDDGNLIASVRAGGYIPPDWSPIYVALMRFTLLGRPDSVLIYLQFVIFVGHIFLLSGLMSQRLLEPVSLAGIFLFILSPASALLTFIVIEQSSYAIFLAQNFFIAAILIMLSKSFSSNRAYRILALACLILASLSRPEFIWSVAAFFFYSQYLNFKARAGLLWSAIEVAVFCVIMLVFYSYFGLLVASEERAMMAFGQHYALRQCEAFQAFELCKNPWVNYPEIVRLGLGDQHSLFQYLLANPAAVFFHALSNALRLVLHLATLGYSAPNFRHVPGLYLPAMAASLVFGLVIFRDMILRILAGIRLTSFDIFLLACSLPFLMSSIVFYPRAHYIVTPILIMILILYRTRHAHQTR